MKEKTLPLFLDTESLPSPAPPPLDEIEAPKNYKDPAKILEFKQEAQHDLWMKEATISHKGRLVCAAWALGDGDPKVVSGPEKEVIGALYGAMQLAYHYIGHNVTFDLLFSAHAGLRHGYAVHKLLTAVKNKWDKPYTDTMELAGFGLEWKNKLSLENLCKLCNVQPPWGKGSDVFAWHQAGDMASIERHCLSDLVAMRNCFYKLTQ